MAENAAAVETLVLLIGGNPMPNYLAAATLRPRRAVLAYTEQTARPKERLAQVLQDLGVAEVGERFIEDPTRAAEIRAAVRGLGGPGTHLNYTGGTKAMAVHAHAELSRDLEPSQCSYIDERNQLLRFDDGSFVPLDEGTLTLATVLALHEVGLRNPDPSPPRELAPTAGDAEAVLRAVLADPALARRLYEYFRDPATGKVLKRKQVKPFDPAGEGLRLSCALIPQPDWENKLFDTWRHFLGGGWLEAWVGAVLAEAGLRDVHTSLHLVRQKRQFELDVVGLRGNRVFAVSCTTSRDLGECKLKLFEVAARARHLGGDLTRSALVCLLGPEQVQQLAQDAQLAWSAAAVPAVFGLEDLRTWAGSGGVAPERSSLQRWLAGG